MPQTLVKNLAEKFNRGHTVRGEVLFIDCGARSKEISCKYYLVVCYALD